MSTQFSLDPATRECVPRPRREGKVMVQLLSTKGSPHFVEGLLQRSGAERRGGISPPAGQR